MRVFIRRRDADDQARMEVDLDHRAPLPFVGQYIDLTRGDPDTTPEVCEVLRVDWQVDYATRTPTLVPRIWTT